MVRVYWQVLRLFPDASTTELLPGQEFTKVSDYVTFADGSSSEVLRLTPREDGIAEQDESFEIRLVNATGKIDTWLPTNFTSKKKKRFNNPKGVISLEPKQLREIKREDVFILEGAFRQHWYVPFRSLSVPRTCGLSSQLFHKISWWVKLVCSCLLSRH